MRAARVLRRLWPTGLAGQFAVLLVAALVAANVVAVGVLSSERARIMREVRRGAEIERFLTLAGALAQVPPAQRPALARATSSPFLRLSVDAGPTVAADGTGRVEALLGRLVDGELLEAGLAGADVRVRVDPGLAHDAPDPPRRHEAGPGHDDDHRDRHLRGDPHGDARGRAERDRGETGTSDARRFAEARDRGETDANDARRFAEARDGDGAGISDARSGAKERHGEEAATRGDDPGASARDGGTSETHRSADGRNGNPAETTGVGRGPRAGDGDPAGNRDAGRGPAASEGDEPGTPYARDGGEERGGAETGISTARRGAEARDGDRDGKGGEGGRDGNDERDGATAGTSNARRGAEMRDSDRADGHGKGSGGGWDGDDERDRDEAGTTADRRGAGERDGDERGTTADRRGAGERDGDERGTTAARRGVEQRDGDEAGTTATSRGAEDRDGDERGTTAARRAAEARHRDEAGTTTVRRGAGERQGDRADGDGKSGGGGRDGDDGGRRWRLVDAFDLSLRLPDGAWVNARVRRPEAPPGEFGRAVVLPLALSLLAVLTVGVTFIRRLTRPVRALAEAAERAGAGDRSATVPVAGAGEVRRAAEAFNRMQMRIARFDAERARAVAAIGHDLRTPITSLRIRAEMLDDEARDAMVRTLDEMRVMADGLLEYGRAGAEAEGRVPLDLAALLRAFAGEGIVYEGPDTLVATGRPVALRRAIGNLVENARRYAGDAVLRLVAERGTAVITVEDRGPGIPDDRLVDVTEPFVRLEGSRSGDTGGAGLGLAIARTLLSAHGGTLTLANRDGGGLVVTVRLPLA